MRHSTLTAKGFQAELATLSEKLRYFNDMHTSGLGTGPEEKVQRQARAKEEFHYFAKTYFPHYISQHDSVLHTYLYKRLPKIVRRQTSTSSKNGVKLAVAAPRGEAKSTLVTQIFTLWCTITRRRRYIPIIMDSQHQASIMLEAIKKELESNTRLLLDFPQACGPGPVL